MRWCWQSAGASIQAVRAVDTVTHPDWRGKGIFSRLTTTLLEDVQARGISFVFNTPNASSMPGYLKMGWKIVTKLPIWVRPLKPFRMAFRVLGKRGSNTEANATNSASHQIPDEVDLMKCLENFRGEGRIHTNRTKEYFCWRYVEVPGFQYHWKHRSNGDASAMIVFRNRMRKSLQELSISELLVSSEGEKGKSLGMHLLKETLKESDADYAVAIAADNSPEQGVLRKCGFIRFRNIGPSLTVRKLNDLESEMDLLDWSNWRCSIGDLELF